MEDKVETAVLEDLIQGHKIATAIFLPFAIHRLQEGPSSVGTTLIVLLRSLSQEADTNRRVSLCWSEENIPPQPFGVQNNTVTEWAALGIGFALLRLFTDLRVETVATPGNCFDYWVTDGTSYFGLEISGTMTDEIETRHQEKIRQVRDNPYRVDCVLIVVSFGTRTAILSRLRMPEVKQ